MGALLHAGAAFADVAIYSYCSQKVLDSALAAACGATFFCLCMNISAHFIVLREIILNTELNDFVKYHQKIIGVTKKVSNLYKPIIFTEFVLVTTILCVSGLQIIKSNDFSKIFVAMFLNLASLVDAAIFAFGAQKVMDSAMAVCTEVYKADKNYLLIIMITQKELKFDVGLFHASLHLLSTILSRTMSFITLLKSFVN
ncbi:odorant receptor 82a-like [Chironomus tepperi]|uniref:odorant receptor 82a-like n=1 Tax=Chironomus tepperi TaxID=113505 RepID=UPI00391F70D1